MRRHHQPVHLRLERTELGRQLYRQHRHGAIREIDAGAAQQRFAVDRRSGPHVVADVGDMDVQRVVAVRQPVDPDGVIEIARGLAVDGDDIADRGNRAAGAISTAGIVLLETSACCRTSSGN